MGKEPNAKGLYFNSALLGEPAYDYVCWLDVMGTGNQMLRSLPIAANFVFKLQCAILEAFEEVDPKGVRLYPVMDGTYITADNRSELQTLLRQTLCRLAITFLNEPKPFHRFLVRGAVAFGPLYHGADLPNDIAYVLSNNTDVRDGILMGLPMAQAHRDEAEAPPFGISVHSSARAFAPNTDKPFRFIWLDWFRYSTPPIDPKQMLAHLNEYFDWQQAHFNATGYRPDRIAHHRQLASEYYTLSG